MPTPINSFKRVAITGAAGYLGRHLVDRISKSYPVRLFDVTALPGEWDMVVGSTADLSAVKQLCEGCTDLVIAHMAPNRPEIYGTPTVPFEVNVTGTANLFHVASNVGIKRVVLISSTAAVQAHWDAGTFLKRDIPINPGKGIYCLTKALQEQIAQFYHRQFGVEISVLRPAYIIDEDTLSDKYGRKPGTVNFQFIDPRDIASAALLSLQSPDLKYEVFYTLGHPDGAGRADVAHTRDFLGWTPVHTFEKYPRDGAV